jgi:hypothetical protein
MRACRLVHWLRAQPSGGTETLKRLLPGDRGGWRLLAALLNWQFVAVRTAYLEVAGVQDVTAM